MGTRTLILHVRPWRENAWWFIITVHRDCRMHQRCRSSAWRRLRACFFANSCEIRSHVAVSRVRQLQQLLGAGAARHRAQLPLQNICPLRTAGDPHLHTKPAAQRNTTTAGQETSHKTRGASWSWDLWECIQRDGGEPGGTHLQLLVEASWSAQGGIEGLGSVCGPQNQQLTWMAVLERLKQSKTHDILV